MSRFSGARQVNRFLTIFATICFSVLAVPLEAFAQGGDASQVNQTPIVIAWVFCLLGSLLALFYARKFFQWVVAQDEGDEAMVKIADYVREGADAYLKQQYRIVVVFFVVVSVEQRGS